MPVYLLFTKADLIAGFAEFFDDLDRERREQVWGVTFPFGKAAATPVGQFPEELQLLVDSLNDRLFDRLQAEQSPERRALIAGFPTQIATLAQPLQGFLVEAFGGSRLDPAPLLRGVYFASGTQEGSPIDRLTGVMIARLRSRPAPRRRPAPGAGAQLLPRATCRAGDLRRGHAGERAADGAHAAADPAAPPRMPSWPW